VGELHGTRLLGGYDRARHVLPALELLSHFSAILEGGEPVASRSEVLGDGTIRGEEALCIPRRFESLQVPLPLVGRLVRVLCAVVEIAVLTMLHTGGEFPLRRPLAGQFVGDNHSGHVLAPFQQLVEKLLGGFLMPATLDENVQHVAVLIHGMLHVAACEQDSSGLPTRADVGQRSMRIHAPLGQRSVRMRQYSYAKGLHTCP
jgi:hypothetical protein